MAAVDDEESPDELLTRARRIANFRGLWPAEFSPDQIAALMAKGWSGFHLQARRDKQKLVSYAIAEGLLLARTEKHTKPVRTITKYGYDEFGVRGSFFKEFRETNTTRRYIGAGDCADRARVSGCGQRGAGRRVRGLGVALARQPQCQEQRLEHSAVSTWRGAASCRAMFVNDRRGFLS